MGSRLAAVALLVLAACERPAGEPRAIDRALISVKHDHVVVRTDSIGVGKFTSDATFALVDADNLGDADAEVTLGGVLVDADGHEAGALRPESLRIPAHGRRTFALVDRGRAARPGATTARVDVRGAREPRFDEPVRITDGHVYQDGDRVVVAGMVENPTDRPCIAMVLASFHDRDGAPQTRPFSAFELGGHARRPTRFVGPSGSVAGQIYVGEILFCPREGCETQHTVEHPLW